MDKEGRWSDLSAVREEKEKHIKHEGGEKDYFCHITFPFKSSIRV
jgi:hypothetical protein